MDSPLFSDFLLFEAELDWVVDFESNFGPDSGIGSGIDSGIDSDVVSGTGSGIGSGTGSGIGSGIGSGTGLGTDSEIIFSSTGFRIWGSMYLLLLTALHTPCKNALVYVVKYLPFSA